MTVFVTQIPHRRASNSDKLLPAVNINTAAEHGDVVIMFDHQSNYFGTRSTLAVFDQFLKDFNQDKDCFLPLGDPVLCAMGSALIAKKVPYFDVLKWDKNLGRYTKNRVVV